MRHGLLWAMLCGWILAIPNPGYGLDLAVTSQSRWLGVPVNITVWAKDRAQGTEAIALSQAELRRLEQQYSPFRQGSVVNELNQFAGERPIQVDPETLQLLKWSENIYKITRGVFDITTATFKWEYGFGQSDFRIPSDLRLQQVKPLVNQQFIVVYPKEETVLFKRQGTQIDLDAVLMNYAFNRLEDIWQRQKAVAACCQIGGSLLVYGKQLPPELTTTTILYPTRKKSVFAILPLKPGKFLHEDAFLRSFEKEGKRVHPFIDVKTARPTDHVLSAVLYLPPKTKIDLPIATLMLLPVANSIRLIESIPQAEYLILDSSQIVWRSKGWAGIECVMPSPTPTPVVK